MVSKFATGYAADSRGRPFLRRNHTPAIVIATVLAVLAIGSWTYAALSGEDKSYPVDCPMPIAGGDKPSFEAASRDEMLGVSPAAQSTFKVTVLNSGAARGEARSVSEDLVAQGFAAADPAYADDNAYGDDKLACVAQIRFGPGGQGAAASIWLALPCAQLVNDGRNGSDVDVALGEYYHGAKPTQDAQAAMEALRTVDPRNPKSGVDRSLIESVHAQGC
ncbi:MAG: envelope integrity protein Cei [Gordonia sp. (in: high G+C Gram-positive bacteria)]|uniref:envelope integrity protein Cei n=1 Tax=Gordonia sp. (in: high G+C Gram-positive bacteria) TaxID=84139 RepID=UPI0039E5CE02